MSRRKRISVYIDPEHVERLKALKARDGMPEAEAVRRALTEFLDRREIGTKSARQRAATRRRA